MAFKSSNAKDHCLKAIYLFPKFPLACSQGLSNSPLVVSPQWTQVSHTQPPRHLKSLPPKRIGLRREACPGLAGYLDSHAPKERVGNFSDLHRM